MNDDDSRAAWKTWAVRRIEHRLAVACGQYHETAILMAIARELNDNVFFQRGEWRELRNECAKLRDQYTGQYILAPYIWDDIRRLKEEGYAQSEPPRFFEVLPAFAAGRHFQPAGNPSRHRGQRPQEAAGRVKLAVPAPRGQDAIVKLQVVAKSVILGDDIINEETRMPTESTVQAMLAVLSAVFEAMPANGHL